MEGQISIFWVTEPLQSCFEEEGGLRISVQMITIRFCRGKKRWILMVPTKGKVLVDEGGLRAVRVRAKSLFSAGIIDVLGTFNAQDAVEICDSQGSSIAIGLTNYSSQDLVQIKVYPISIHKFFYCSCILLNLSIPILFCQVSH